MSTTAISTASSAEARASSIRPSGSSSFQLSHGPSGLEYRPRLGITPYCSGAMVQSCASCMYWAS